MIEGFCSRAGLPPVSSSLCPRFGVLLHRLRDEEASPALRGILFAGPLSAMVSAHADDITVFVSRCLDIKAVKKAVARYEQIARAKINYGKSEGLRLGAWRGGFPYPDLSAGVTDPFASSGYGSGPTSN